MLRIHEYGEEMEGEGLGKEEGAWYPRKKVEKK